MQEVMRDPVTATDGITYERAAIEEWLQRRSASSQASDGQMKLVPNLVRTCAVLQPCCVLHTCITCMSRIFVMLALSSCRAIMPGWDDAVM